MARIILSNDTQVLDGYMDRDPHIEVSFPLFVLLLGIKFDRPIKHMLLDLVCIMQIFLRYLS